MGLSYKQRGGLVLFTLAATIALIVSWNDETAPESADANPRKAELSAPPLSFESNPQRSGTPALAETPQDNPASLSTQRPLSERMRFDTEGLEVVEHADGRQSMHLQGRFLHMATKAVDSDGQHIAVCTSNHDHLQNPPNYAAKTDAQTPTQIR